VIDAEGKEHVFHNGMRCRIPDEMPLAACELLVVRVWADYHPGRTPPRVTPGHLARNATGSRHRINLPRWARQVPVVLHELTHSLLPDAAIVHGPEFVRLYIELLVRYWTRHPLCRQAMQEAGMSNLRQHLLTTARGAGLKIARLDKAVRPASPVMRRQWKRQGYLSDAGPESLARLFRV